MDEDIRCLVKRTSHPGVSGATDATRPVHFAGLPSPWGKAEMGSDIARFREPRWVVDGRNVGQCHQRSDARHRHQAAAGLAGLRTHRDLSVERGNLACQMLYDIHEGLQDRSQRRVLESGVDGDPELRSGELRWPQALGLQDRPDPVAEIERLTPKLLADRQNGPDPLRANRFDPDGAEFSGGSVSLNWFRAFSRWISASVTPPPLWTSAG